MSYLLHQLIQHQANRNSSKSAIELKGNSLSYGELNHQVEQLAYSLSALGVQKGDRVAIYLPKQFETVVAIFATAMNGAIFVPINPQLKPQQVKHILDDCTAHTLITSNARAQQLEEQLTLCRSLRTLITTDAANSTSTNSAEFSHHLWSDLLQQPCKKLPSRMVIDSDIAAILYTSGSTGQPKGVVLSHRNLICGAESVAEYLNNHSDDRILALLPFSFDYGFSQLTTAFHVGATAVLMDYLLPRDVVKAVSKYAITGLAAVPPLWNQISQLEWPADAQQTLRYITNSGGAMPTATLAALQKKLPNTSPYLMYGLTEAFRSTYLPPDQLAHRPTSMGKAIPNAEIMVVREDGTPCAPGEPGELVHRGSLVGQGYWNDPERTAERYKPSPGSNPALPMTELAVWSGDTVKMDEEGYLYFIGRKDDMIKTNGYRVSPTEVEEVIYASGQVAEAAAIGIPHNTLGQAIVVIVTLNNEEPFDRDKLLSHCKQQLPNFMIPLAIQHRSDLPRNPNGKIDRKFLATEYQDLLNEQ